ARAIIILVITTARISAEEPVKEVLHILLILAAIAGTATTALGSLLRQALGIDVDHRGSNHLGNLRKAIAHALGLRNTQRRRVRGLLRFFAMNLCGQN